uniref:Beta-carotene isomerase D27-like C-terminal domain-containing protein n=1 Tax=Compsopogon caeruleus TaxID=31354 RepID=A0A7S1XFH2_9RHOD|mmetsp:Transcript_3590/g.6806  ORF Transcript_3590/g.6806 Transcript_3590/m.6806 type:complete len:260 (+) Transcript_3590:147-926(+)|eukprot:CAMPEP_0184680650 /NCGR_PEP_ID=MMETSP0312-20130426/3554_1 /TAXON_ID=31354 /ORGANISM="Compsopogon coeruleus, Strain SAG 36.94" /LENGTH=259 /DNA_ID=CAMNT_0027130921 /DNA_START=103 /DNA_END=882 /DNA_ORIENTATION=-
MDRQRAVFVVGPVVAERRTRDSVRSGERQGKEDHAWAVSGRDRCVGRSKLVWMSSSVGPEGPAPNYQAVDRNIFSKVLMGAFGASLERECATSWAPEASTVSELRFEDQGSSGFSRIRDLVWDLKRMYAGDGAGLSDASHRVLQGLFPGWFLKAFVQLFAQPLPEWSARLVAGMSAATTRWLMGASAVDPDGVTLVVERCRFLEECGCISICHYGCKRPTERFISRDMGIPLWMEVRRELAPHGNDDAALFISPFLRGR